MDYRVERTQDFAPTGAGDHPSWATAPWMALTSLNGPAPTTRAKMLYSATGVYALFDCDDTKLRCAHDRDFADLYDEDVVEIFIRPDESQRSYFEYEVSPLGFELPLMIVNDGKRFHGWLPWKYAGERKCRFATSVRGGPKKAEATVTGWSAEMFIPNKLLLGLANVPPQSGTRWRANLYRIDYDDPKSTKHWSWNPLPRADFHLIDHMGTLIFA